MKSTAAGSLTRRRALAAFAAWLAGSPLLRSQQEPRSIGEPAGRIAPPGELANTLEFAPMAQRSLSSALYAKIAEGDRDFFDRITFRVRLMVSVENLDLTVRLLGETMFAPILVGPAAHQKRFHAGGEATTVRGAEAAKTAVVVSDRADVAVEQIAAQTAAPLWRQIHLTGDDGETVSRIERAVDAGGKIVFLTVGTPHSSADWEAIAGIRRRVDASLVLKGVMSPNDARKAAEHGLEGIVVSNHGGRFVPGLAQPIRVLPSIAEALDGRIAVLIDGGFRRGSDILKALALGAEAVMVARPAMWGLAAYGEVGVQSVLELLQTELASDMAMLGAPDVETLTPDFVRIHRR